MSKLKTCASEKDIAIHHKTAEKALDMAERLPLDKGDFRQHHKKLLSIALDHIDSAQPNIDFFRKNSPAFRHNNVPEVLRKHAGLRSRLVREGYRQLSSINL